MSLRTSFWLLPQNEHFKVPLPSRVRAMGILASCLLRLLVLCGRERGLLAHRTRRGLRCDDFVDDPIVLRLLGGHEKVPVGVLLDLVHRLSGVVRSEEHTSE